MTDGVRGTARASSSSSPPSSERGAEPSGRRARIADGAVLLVLAAVLVLQDPGRTRFDTKLDLVVDPWGFLARAFSAWDSSAGFGQLQNQAYGYLFPMGPFFGVAHSLGLPPWIAQALWAWLLLATAYLGLRVLASRLGLPWYAAVVGALAYALAPRLVTVIGPLSAEALPAALLPWALVPLAGPSTRTPRRTALYAAVPVLLMGAANATLTLAVLPAVVLWMLCRREGRWRLLGWWSLFVALFSAWWAVPLLIQARYATPFLTFIETARDTTGGLSPDRVIRGDVHWVAGIIDRGLPWWPAGFQYTSTAWIVAGTLLVAGMGLAGLASRRMPERVPAALTALLGLVAMAAGSLLSPSATAAWALLDGPLSPFRNVHKLDPLLRLPLSLGVAAAVVAFGAALSHTMSRRGAHEASRRWARAVPAAAAGALVVAVAAPMVSPGISAGRTWSELPPAWEQAATWLGDQQGDGRALVVPGSGFGQYLWGRTIDEPLQPLAERPWAIDNGLPLGSVGSARVLDSVSAALRQGRAVPGLAETLARSGISYVVVRNDLDVDRTSSPSPSVVAATLTQSDGLERAAVFGPARAASGGITITNFDRDGARPAIEVYRVTVPVAGVSATALSSVGVMTGGPEALLAASASGLVGADQPVVMADDGVVPGLGGPQLITDSLMRRDRALGRGDESLSSVQTADEPSRVRRRSPDLVPFADPHYTVAAFRGIAGVSASSARSYADTFSDLRTEHQPFAAVDGDPATWWQSGAFGGPEGQWLRIDLRARIDARGTRIRLVRSDLVGSAVGRITVSTGDATWDEDVAADGTVGPMRDDALDGITSLTITAADEAAPVGGFGIREVSIPGVTASMPLLTPVPPAAEGRTSTVVLAARSPARPTCTTAEGDVRCDPRASRAEADGGVLDRLVAVRDTVAGSVQLVGQVRQGPAASELFDPVGEGIKVRGTSWLGSDVRVRPSAAADGDPATRWVAGLYDPAPALQLSWGTPRTISSVRLVAPAGGQTFAVPLAVRIELGGRTIDAELGPGATVALPPTSTSSIRIAITRTSPVASVDGTTGLVSAVPVAVSEIELGGAADLVYRPDPLASTGAACGLGPALEIDGQRVPTSVVTTLGEVLAGREVGIEPCTRSGAVLASGTHRIVLTRTGLVDPLRVVVGVAESGPAEVVLRSTSVQAWDVSSRTVDVGSGPAAVLRVPESANAGWTAQLDGAALVPLRIDGWQQGWIVPEGAGGRVVLAYAPTATQQAGLAAGAAAAVAGLLIGLMGRRRDPEQRWSSGPVVGLVRPLPEVAVLASGT
ncbi:MAG: alpha-(1-_3)-arabinofuranosyltransferase family protein, partial [Candidatus Nanopelagicales bacterium]